MMEISSGDIYYSRQLRGFRKMHIHHADNDVVVFKCWNKYRQKWKWEVEQRWLFEYCVDKFMYAKNKKALKQ